MTTKTLHIKNSTPEFLNLVNKLKADKAAKVDALLKKKVNVKAK